MIEGWGFNPPPHWPKPPGSWTPPAGWTPDPAWGPLPPGWQLWVPARRTQRRHALPALFGLAAVLAGAVLAATVPRASGPGTDDPRTGGIVARQRPALIVPVDTASPSADATGSPSADATGSASPVPARVEIRQFATCAELNQVYPNGVGLPDAVDRTTGTAVTDFGRSTTIYRANLQHDEDGDQIACEPA